MEGKLYKEYKPKTVEEVRESLEEVRQSIPADMLRNMFHHYEARMQRVFVMGGDCINN